MPYLVPEDCLPIELPEVTKFLPTETGEPPLGNATHWAWDEANRCVTDNSRIDHKTVFPLELSTMPGFAGSLPTISAIWILTTMKHWWVKPLSTIGNKWISMWVVRNTLLVT